MSLRVAVVGTGRMGSAMVGRVTGGGFPVVVHNRSRDKAVAVAARYRCEVADTARDAVAGADIVLVSLPDDAAAHAAYGADAGIVAGLARDAVVADTSTIAPATVRGLAADVADVGATLLDTPVSGSVSTVEAGTLTVMAGGDPSALDRVRPVLETLASSIVHCGPQGSGAALKLAVNTIVHALDIALSEALVLAEKAGLDRETAYDVFAHSAVGAPFVHYKRAAFLSPEAPPVAFALDLVAKDLELAAALASEVGARTPQLERNREVVADAVSTGLGGADLSAVAEYLRR